MLSLLIMFPSLILVINLLVFPYPGFMQEFIQEFIQELILDLPYTVFHIYFYKSLFPTYPVI